MSAVASEARFDVSISSGACFKHVIPFETETRRVLHKYIGQFYGPTAGMSSSFVQFCF